MHDPEKNLEVYLVGGAVRDTIMGIAVKDRDWVVVGATPQEMITLGFKPVGKDFPVFLHPQTNEEYALARTEKKTAKGYHGFEFQSAPDVSLQEDLSRRDLTMNAIAMDGNGKFIDPFNGIADIENKVIRHVSNAFSEDPVRILRVARFACRFSAFTISKPTRALMRKMVEEGEVDALVPERVWQEMQTAMLEENFSTFLKVLRDCAALKSILPEVDALFGVPQTEKYHPEIDTGIHIIMSLDAAVKMTRDPKIIFAVLVHDLGKALTPKDELPGHRGHEKRGLAPIKALSKRLGVSSQFRKFALKVCAYHLHCHRMAELKPATVLKLLEAFDGFRNPTQISDFTVCCDADKRGRTGHENDDTKQSELLLRYHQAALSVNQGVIAASIKSAQPDENPGNKIRKEINRQRLEIMKQIKRSL